MPETTLILESFAAARNDLSFQVPIGRLRLLRSQIETRLGLPHCQEYNPAWSICCSEIAAVLTTAECKAALDKQVQVEEQTLRLNTLLYLCMSWPSYWCAQEDDDYVRLRCFRTSWDGEALTRLLNKKEDDDPFFVERAQVVLEHLDAMSTVVKQLPEGSWLAAAAGAVEIAQRFAKCVEEAEGATEKA